MAQEEESGSLVLHEQSLAVVGSKVDIEAPIYSNGLSIKSKDLLCQNDDGACGKMQVFLK